MKVSVFFLSQQIQDNGLSEQQSAKYIKDILSAVQYMHSNYIVHRDLTCRNIVFDRPGKDGVLKVIDFGLSEIIHKENENEIDDNYCGTLYYLAPGIFLFDECCFF